MNQHRNPAHALILSLVLCLMTSCVPPNPSHLGTRLAGSDYEALFPYTIELSALSQIKPLGGAAGGSAGHAVLYLKGARVDTTLSYPALALLAAEDFDPGDADAGVGVSVNKIFRNVNWVAIPGKTLFYHGALAPDHRLTKEHFEETVARVSRMGLYRHIEIHDEYLADRPEGRSAAEHAIRKSISTDFALKFGRSVFTIRLPVTREVMGDVIAALNAMNRRYAEGEADYNWSAYHDNCSHTVHNALAGALIWEPKNVNEEGLQQLANVSIPANEFADLAILATKGRHESTRELMKDEFARRCLERYGWLPTRHGALLETIGAHRDNALYDPGLDIFVLEAPVLRAKTSAVRRLLENEDFTDLRANLLHFRERYTRILAENDGSRKLRGSAERYYAYVGEQLADLEAKLNLLEAGD